MDLTKSAQLLDHALQNGVFPCYAAAIGQGKDIWFYKSKGYRTLYQNLLALQWQHSV